MSVKTELDSFFMKRDAEVVAPLVDKLMNLDFVSSPSPNSLVPENIVKENLREEFTKFFNGEDILQHIESGFESIGQDIKSHLTPVEHQNLQKEWTEGINRLITHFQKKEEQLSSQESAPIMLEEIMGLSESTIEYFYAVGMRLYAQKQFQKANDVFYILTLLNTYRHNVWLAWGLSQQHEGHLELALNAYAMAAITDVDSPSPYIHSAECCLAMLDRDEALRYLDIAKSKLDHSQDEQSKKLLTHVNKLKEECQRK